MLQKLQPKNELSEKRKFMSAVANGLEYNPVFKYEDETFCQSLVMAFDNVFYSNKYADMAEKLLEDIVLKYGSGENYKDAVWGSKIGPLRALTRANSYVKEHNITAKIGFGKSLVTTMGRNSLSLVKTSGYYRSIRLESLLDHELSVHYLRSQNHILLPADLKMRIRQERTDWVRRRVPEGTAENVIKRLIEQTITADEEGLASVVTTAWYQDCFLFFQPALSNHIVHLAKVHSFYECFKTIRSKHYCADNNDAWLQVLRAKRGLTDTSMPGAFCKDILSYVGAMDMLKNLDIIDIQLFFVGKLRVDEYFKFHDSIVKHSAESSGIQLPHFLETTEKKSEFLNTIQAIRLANFTYDSLGSL